MVKRDHRPDGVPESAMVFYAGIGLPGDNTQRTGSFRKKLGWQAKAKHHFSLCADGQEHLGMLDKPKVLIEMHVARVGDENAQFGRAKWIIDRLQPRKETHFKLSKPRVKKGGIIETHGVRTYGLLDLIHDDKSITKNECTFVERYAPKNQRRVVMWVWNDQ